MTAALPPTEVLDIEASDGVHLAAAVYRPAGAGPFPILFAASPYRFDNNTVPASQQFLWRETGPIDLYVDEGYAYVHLDLRGCGRSGGTFEFLGKREQQDLYEAIEYVAALPWSNGRVGTIGQSYYCMVQWHIGAMSPPSLACIGAHDGLADLYRAGCYHGGIACDFFPGYWWYQNRVLNRSPSNGPGQEQLVDLGALIAAHPLRDEFWRERSAHERLGEISVPLYSSGVWGKMQLHTRGNIDGYLAASGPKKLRMSAAPNAWAAAAEYSSAQFHRDVMLPFYDRHLKGIDTGWDERPAVEWFVRGSGVRRTAHTWPPTGMREQILYLDPVTSGSVHSLNDGSLGAAVPPVDSATAHTYPDAGWVSGTVGFAPGGAGGGFDAARRVLTFTGPSLTADLEIAGPIRLTLFLSSSGVDTDVFVKLSDQAPCRGDVANPAFEIVSRGWLRASHRALDAGASEAVPLHPHDREDPIVPGEVYRLDISLEPQAYVFRAGHRVRLEIANGDSPVTEALWSHLYRPSQIGVDHVHHGPSLPSHLVLPVLSN